MNRQKVESSNITSIGYDEKNKLLEVEFISSGLYEYSNVEKEIYNFFLSSPSKGKYFFKNIKGKYQFTKK